MGINELNISETLHVSGGQANVTCPVECGQYIVENSMLQEKVGLLEEELHGRTYQVMMCLNSYTDLRERILAMAENCFTAARVVAVLGGLAYLMLRPKH